MNGRGKRQNVIVIYSVKDGDFSSTKRASWHQAAPCSPYSLHVCVHTPHTQCEWFITQQAILQCEWFITQQAVLQCVVLCQEQERRTLVEILHSVSQEELQEQRHTLTPDYKAAGATGSALRRGCVSILRQIKPSLPCSSTHSSVSWADCAVHLLIRLTHTHDEEVQTVIHTLPVMDAAALMVLLHKYELELRSPELHNLHNLLQTSGSEDIQMNICVADSERTDQRRNTPSVSEEQEICTGCGGVLVPDDTPYLEILSVRDERDEERREEREEEEERREEREEEEDERREEREEEKRNVDSMEKQGSLITLAWSKPMGNNTQEVTSALPEAQVMSADSHTADHTHSAVPQCEHTPTAQTHTLVEPLQEQSTSSMDAQNESSSDEHGTTSAVLELDLENTLSTGETHTKDAVCDAACEVQQLQRDATMRSLVDIQRRAEQRWQRDRDRQIFRVQERLSIIQNRKSDEDLLGLRHEGSFRHLTNTLQQEDEQQQKVLVREKLQQLWRERSYILQTRRERNTTEFKELLTPTAQCATNTDDVVNTRTHTST